MAFLQAQNLVICGMSAAVPRTCRSTEDIYKWDGCEKFQSTTGIRYSLNIS
jgi:hypothetical protein